MLKGDQRPNSKRESYVGVVGVVTDAESESVLLVHGDEWVMIMMGVRACVCLESFFVVVLNQSEVGVVVPPLRSFHHSLHLLHISALSLFLSALAPPPPASLVMIALFSLARLTK